MLLQKNGVTVLLDVKARSSSTYVRLRLGSSSESPDWLAGGGGGI
jgi:hypothetical protein